MYTSNDLRHLIVTRYSHVLVNGTGSLRVYDHCYRLVKAYAKATNRNVQTAWNLLALDAEAFLN